VICCYGGGVKLIDFGIARAAGKVSQTRAGLIKGKVCYMSPEQLREQPMDHRSDIFAAGVILWELLAGRSLFGGKSDRETIVNIAHVHVPDLQPLRPQVPAAVVRVVHQALQREPEARPAWGSDMAEALRDAMGWHGDSEGRAQLAAFLSTHFA
jgi:serine/threonine protein kinase